MSNRAIAHRLGVSETAIRKLIGPSQGAESAQLAFAGMPAAVVAQRPAATEVPSATSTGGETAGPMPSADRSDDRDPVAPDEDGEPMPMSLDQDASDQSFDRLLALEARTDLAVELAADAKQPTLDHTWERKQDTDAGNRGPIAEQRCRVIEHPQIYASAPASPAR